MSFPRIVQFCGRYVKKIKEGLLKKAGIQIEREVPVLMSVATITRGINNDLLPDKRTRRDVLRLT